MMAKRNRTVGATMTLPSRTAIALWVGEISGQISDGTWENSRPHNHWQFWSDVDVEFGPVARVLGDTGWCVKNAYALLRLPQMKFEDGTYILRDRMLRMGRMAKAGANPNDRNVLSAAEYMPETLLEWTTRANAGSWEHDFIAKYMSALTPELVEAYYATTYTLKEMRKDLTLIHTTMKSVKVW